MPFFPRQSQIVDIIFIFFPSSGPLLKGDCVRKTEHWVGVALQLCFNNFSAKAVSKLSYEIVNYYISSLSKAMKKQTQKCLWHTYNIDS